MYPYCRAYHGLGFFEKSEIDAKQKAHLWNVFYFTFKLSREIMRIVYLTTISFIISVKLAIQDMASNLNRKWRALLPQSQAKSPVADGSIEGESRRLAVLLSV